ncbi:MAG TPA: ParB/RepB/Spo0J family partition protein [Candidatus Doudnabacteria bacterium]|nr:ParB/RepB/Spo0J family partition protein [Candidatus Doudnabacteria bacterium]
MNQFNINPNISEPAPEQSDNDAGVISYSETEIISQPETTSESQNTTQEIFVPTVDLSEKVSYADSSIQEIEVSKVMPNPFQPRKVFNQEALQELASSIKEHGVIQPIVVTQVGEGYELVVGERRFRASQLAGLQKVPAIVKQTLHDQTKLEVALIENIQRQELNAIEEAQAFQRLIDKFSLTQEQVAQKVGKSRPSVANTLRLLNLPAEIQRAIIEGKISEGHGRAILSLPDIERQLLMYKQVLEQGLNVRQVEAKVRELVQRRKMDAAMPDPKLIAIESELRGKLGTQVKIQRQGRGGKITIEFFSDEDLNDILHRIAEEKKDTDDGYLVV